MLLLILFASVGPVNGGWALFALGALGVVGVAVWYAALSFTNMERFVVVTLFVRSSLDTFKNQGTRDSPPLRAGKPHRLAFLCAAVIFLSSTERLPAERPGAWLGRSIALFATAGVVSVIGSGELSTTLPFLLRVLASVAIFFVVERLLVATRRPLAIVHGVLLGGVFARGAGLHRVVSRA